MMKTYVFPGQGSQKKGMGATLFDEFPDITKQADDVLGYSVKKLCLEDPEQQLNQTQYTQPALYVVNALSYLKKLKDGSPAPDYVAGHSLGEYNALYAAEVFDFAEGLKLVKKRGELMSRAKDGGMAAIINISENQIHEILHEAGLTTVGIANLNSPTQIIISGLKEDVNKAQSYFEKAGAMFMPLNTSGAFHSQYMKKAETEFSKVIKKTKFSKPKIKVVANSTGLPYTSNNIARNLINQISNCVKWTDSIVYLLEQCDMEFEELGVGDVLTKLIRSIKKDYDSKRNNDNDIFIQKSQSGSQARETITSNASTEPLESEVSVDDPVVATQPDILDPKEMVEQWNKVYPIGTKVISIFYDTILETKTEAVLLLGHRAAIYLKGYNGYFDLKEIKPAE